MDASKFSGFVTEARPMAFAATKKVQFRPNATFLARVGNDDRVAGSDEMFGGGLLPPLNRLPHGRQDERMRVLIEFMFILPFFVR
ncbi:MAG: hypothetical protein U0132_02150 [Gemmatimonadaceae bacterium]